MMSYHDVLSSYILSAEVNVIFPLKIAVNYSGRSNFILVDLIFRPIHPIALIPWNKSKWSIVILYSNWICLTGSYTSDVCHLSDPSRGELNPFHPPRSMIYLFDWSVRQQVILQVKHCTIPDKRYVSSSVLIHQQIHLLLYLSIPLLLYCIRRLDSPPKC